MKGQIFILGVGRSGTTILVKSLSTHPEIIPVPGPGSEMPYLNMFINSLAEMSEGTWSGEIFSTYSFDPIQHFGHNFTKVLEEEFILKYNPALARHS